MPKSALPMGTTPHRRKNTVAKKAVTDNAEYCLTETAVKNVPAKNKPGHTGRSNDKETKTYEREKENTLNGGTSSQEAMDDLDKSMARINLNDESRTSTNQKFRDVKLPFYEFPPIKCTVTSSQPLGDSVKSLRAATQSLTPALLETIHRNSLKPTASLALEENCSNIKQVIKQCLKSPSINELRLAIHCLRSITNIIDKSTVVKLCFHCCVLAGEGMLKCLDSKQWKEVGRYGVLTLASYQTLGRCIRGNGKFTSWDDVLVVPTKKGILPKRQMIKICVESGISASCAFMHLTLLSMREMAIENEFGLDLRGDFQSILVKAVLPVLSDSEEGDGTKFSKRIFRFLWDGARCVDDTKMILHLQCLAVTTLAKCCLSAISYSNSDLQKELRSLWDRSSSSALKAVAVLDKQATDDEITKTALLEFHNVAGVVLDNVWIQFNNHADEKLAPSSYFEYCTYRSIQQWKILGAVHSVHGTKKLLRDKDKYSNEDGESLAAMSSYSVVLLSLAARMEFTEKDNASCDAVVSNFDAVILRSASPTSLYRCRSMIMLLNLQREATKMIASRGSDSSATNKRSLSTLGYVLGRCIAPLESKLAREHDQQKSLNLRLSASDNHAKAASFLDAALKDSSVSNKIRGKWNDECVRQIRKGFELLLPVLERIDDLESGSPSILAVETFAKTAATISKNLSDINNTTSSIECQMYASDLLTRLASKGLKHASFDKYQIPNRYMLLASALKDNGNAEESCAALALAVWSAAKKNAHDLNETEDDDISFVGDTVSEETLLFPGAALYNVHSISENMTVTNGMSVMINKLTRSCIDMMKSCCLVSRRSAPKETMLAKTIQIASDESKKLCVSKLLNSIIWGNGDFTLIQTLELIRTLTKSMSKVLKSYSSYKSDTDTGTIFSIVLNELNEYLRLQLDRLKRMLPPEDWQVISSALRVSFAMSLLDSQFLRFPKPHTHLINAERTQSMSLSIMLRCSLDQLRQSEKLFVQAAEEHDCVQDACFKVQWAAVLLHKTIVSEHQIPGQNDGSSVIALVGEYSRVLDICSQATDHLLSTKEETPPFQVVESLITTMKKLLCRFGLHGDPISSSQCLIYLQKIYSLDDQTHHIFDSVSDFLWISSKFQDLAAILLRNCVFNSIQEAKDALGATVQQLPDELMDLISDCTVKLVANFSQQLPTQAEDMHKMERSLQQISEFMDAYSKSIGSKEPADEFDYDVVCARSEAIVQIHFFVITSLMLRSQIFINTGQPERSIKCLNSCRIECKRMISLLRLPSSRLPNSEEHVIRVDDVLSMCLERLSIAYSSLGIRRKAEDSAMLGLMKQKLISTESPSINNITFQELIGITESLGGMYNVLPSIRTLITIKSLSLSLDKFSMNSPLFDDIDFSNFSHCTSVNDKVSRSQTFLTYNDSFRFVPDYKSQCDTFISLAHKSIASLTNQPLPVIPIDVPLPLDAFVGPTEHEIKIRMMRQEGCSSSTPKALENLVNNHKNTRSCLAEAYFDLGIEALEKARSGNELNQLWRDHIVIPCDSELGEVIDNSDLSLMPNIIKARQYFNCAFLHAKPASNFTTKKILRCLALVTGPEMLSSFLIHASVGGMARNIVRDGIDPISITHNIFNLFDNETLDLEARVKEFSAMLSKFSSIIPSCWSISTMAICPPGDILITSLKATSDGDSITKTVCILASSSNNNNIIDNIMLPLDKIVARSQKQLCGIDEETQSDKYSEETARRNWWNERHSIDDDIRLLLHQAEDSYFGYDIVRQLIVPASTDSSEDDGSECSDIGPGNNLVSRFDAAEQEPVISFDDDAARLSLKKMTVAMLKEKLESSFGVGGLQVQKMRKADLINLVLNEMEEEFHRISNSKQKLVEIDEHAVEPSNECRDDGEPCTILILDEHLHRLPLESMDMFENVTVTRMPSLPFVFAALQERLSEDSNTIPQIDSNRVRFILDPERNLSETASKLEPALNSIALSNNWDWKGCVGQMPTPEFMTDAITQANGLLLYCGHGGGERFFSRSRVEDLIACSSEDESQQCRGCLSSIVLMGCSSGKLKSVNSPKENPSDQMVYPMHYEPEGMALSYIFAGAPCVVGNLWDVTDRDIDRYCLTLLKDFFDQPNEDSLAPSLAKCVSSARRACKLRYVVGGAPICYGIPVFNRNNPPYA